MSTLASSESEAHVKRVFVPDVLLANPERRQYAADLDYRKYVADPDYRQKREAGIFLYFSNFSSGFHSNHKNFETFL